MIPPNIAKEHVIQAIQEIELLKGNIPSNRESVNYDVIYQGKRYSPKFVISIANKYANGTELSATEFDAIEAKTFLPKLGFEVKLKFDIKPGDIIANEQISTLFSCGIQGGMRKSNKNNILIIISDLTKPFYHDEWIGDILHYTGMGVQGNQKIDYMQNKTLNESKINGVEVHLFEVFSPHKYTYQGIVELVGNYYVKLQPDKDGNERNVVIFPLRLVSGKRIVNNVYWVIKPWSPDIKDSLELWQKWKSLGIVSIPWKELSEKLGSNLLNFSSYKEYKSEYNRIFPNSQADMVWKFIYQMKTGDEILVNWRYEAILGKGIITSQAKIFDKSAIDSIKKSDILFDSQIYREIKWEENFPENPIPQEIKRKFSRLVFELNQSDYNQIFGGLSEPTEKNMIGNQLALVKREYERLNLKPIDLNKVIESVPLNPSLSDRTRTIRHPEKVKINQVLDYCSSGDWVLPHFQRYFEWKQNDIRLFLEAIFNNYYVGAFLLWETEREPEVGIQLIHGIDVKGELRPRSIILDGQQRITSIVYAIIAPKFEKFSIPSYWTNTGIQKEHPSYFYIDFAEYLINPQSSEIIRVFNKKVSKEICFERMLFPFSELPFYNDWISEFEETLETKTEVNHKKISVLRNVMRKKIESILEFEFPYISLPTSLSLDQVTDIFLGVNTRGKPLDVFDLLIARLYKYNIELKKLWEKSLETYPNVNRYAKENKKIPEYILQSISLYYSSAGSVKKADILDVYKNIFENSSLKFEEQWDEFSKYTDIAIKKLENLGDGFGIRSEKDLPYASIIPILTSLLKTIESQPNPTQSYRKLEKWYWASIFTSAYSSAVETQMASDFKEMKDWFVDNSKTPSSILNLMRDINNLEFRSVKSESNVKYRGVLSLIALAGAKDFATGLRLENARKNEKDHIFPKSDKEFNSLKDINSVLNITWNSADTNKKIKFVKKPNVFIKEFISNRFENKEEDFIKLLETHLISGEAYRYLIENNFEGFISEREKTILQKIYEIFEIKEIREFQTLISPDTPFSNKKIYSGTIKNCSGYIHWIDKYFSKIGLEILIDSVNFEKIKEIKILMAIEKVDVKFRDAFKDFKQELFNKGIIVELKVIDDNNIRKSIHDRWIIAENVSYNIPSPDVVMRGQFSEIKETKTRPPFDEWWENSKDIVKNWTEIEKRINKIEKS